MEEKGKALAERTETAIDIVTSPEVLQLLVQIRGSAPALTHTVKRIEELNKTGALDTLIDFVQVMQSATVSAGDPMIHRIGNMLRVLAEMGDTVMLSDLPEKIPALMQAATEAKADAEADQGTVGLMGLLKALRQPEIQFALKFMLALSRRLPEAAK